MNVNCNECNWDGFEDDLVYKNGKTSHDDDYEFNEALFCPECGYRVLEMSSEVPKNSIEAFDMDIESDPDTEYNLDSLGQD